MATKTNSIKGKELKNEYMKQRRRIQSWIRRAKKSGYNVQYELPSIPKKITQASVNRLAKVSSEKLYSKSTYQIASVNDKTGEIQVKTISGKEAKKYRQKQGAKKSARTRKFIKQYGYTPKEYYGEDTYYMSDSDIQSSYKSMLDNIIVPDSYTSKQLNTLDKITSGLSVLAMQLDFEYGSGAGEQFIDKLGLVEVWWAYNEEAMTQNLARAMKPLNLSYAEMNEIESMAYSNEEWDLEYYNFNTLDNE